MEKEGLTIVKNLLSDADFEALLRITTTSKRSTKVIYGAFSKGTEEEERIASVINETANKRIKDLNNYVLKDALLRYEDIDEKTYSGLLHHDLNKRDKRKYTLILYVEKPEAGGRIVFPFYDSNGERVSNVVTEACEKLYDKGEYVASDSKLTHYAIDNRDELYSFRPEPNVGLILDDYNRNLWHVVCPTEEGQRTAAVFFWEK